MKKSAKITNELLAEIKDLLDSGTPRNITQK
jgi:hypothetical protein